MRHNATEIFGKKLKKIVSIDPIHSVNNFMEKQITSWFSPSLNKEMPIVTYGYYGIDILLIPTAGADYL